MNEEWKKMLRGEPYHALDPEILSMLFKTKDAVWAYNQLKPSQLEARETCIKRILGHCGVQPVVISGVIFMLATISSPISILPSSMRRE